MAFFLELIKAIAYGILFAVTEWLPVSSEIHFFMAESVLPLAADEGVSDPAFMTLFLNTLRLGACVASAAVFFNRIWPFSPKKSPARKKAILRTWAQVFAATLLLILVLVLVKDRFAGLFSSPVTAGVILIIAGAVMLGAGRLVKKPQFFAVKELTFRPAFLTGCAQVLSVIPGTSRVGAALMAGRMNGMDRVSAGEFACFLSIPALLVTAVFKLYGLHVQLTLPAVILLAAGICSCVLMSMFVIHSLLKYLQTGGLRLFGYYRIALGLMILIQSLLGMFPEGLEVLI